MRLILAVLCGLIAFPASAGDLYATRAFTLTYPCAAPPPGKSSYQVEYRLRDGITGHQPITAPYIIIHSVWAANYAVPYNNVRLNIFRRLRYGEMMIELRPGEQTSKWAAPAGHGWVMTQNDVLDITYLCWDSANEPLTYNPNRYQTTAVWIYYTIPQE